MPTASLGKHGAWVQCKHLYHILQYMYCGQFEDFIHYPMWSWDEVQRLLACAKTFDSRPLDLFLTFDTTEIHLSRCFRSNNPNEVLLLTNYPSQNPNLTHTLSL
jgi:hypothetical protein